MIISAVNYRVLPNSNINKTHNNINNRYIKNQNINQSYQYAIPFQAATYSKAISDSIWHGYVKDAPRLNRIATTYLDTVEAVANKYKEYGVSFIREMFESTAVKEPDSKVSKIVRAKTFDDRDAIRTTLFIKNPYDLSILFDKIIPELGPAANRIYEIARIKLPVEELMKKGYIPIDEIGLIKIFFEIPHDKDSHNRYFRELKKLKYDYDDTKKILSEYLKSNKNPTQDDIINIAKSLKKDMPDIDIRLNKKLLDLNTLPDEYKYCVGKPHGPYEDIQIRFIRTVDKDAERPIYHELLIHFGPTYNRNAFKEHKWVYEPLRLFGELNIPIDENVGKYIDFDKYPEQAVAKYIGDIKEMFRTKVSDKLIRNGKNVDYYGNNDEEAIFFTDNEIVGFDKKIKSLKYHLRHYYEKELQSTAVSQNASEQTKKNLQEDIKLINKIRKDLDGTIYNVNYENGLKQV